LKEVVVPRELNHFAQRRSVSFTANLAPTYSLGEALKFMNEVSARVLKTGYSTDLNGRLERICTVQRFIDQRVRVGPGVHFSGVGCAV
jgi:multidrug efflux pump subunit AcrB